MDSLELLIDFHQHSERQGPGSADSTALALQLAGIDTSASLAIADIGCGTGASTLQLATMGDAHVTAVDFLPAFLDVLEQRARDAGVARNITTLCASMDSLPFADGAFDVIWR
ncbi:MAG: class I SAM-dependent methyltransferase [Pseudomonadota bacterium]